MKRLHAIGFACLAALPCAAQLQQEYGISGHMYALLNGGAPEPGFQHGMSFYTTLFALTPNPSTQLQLGTGNWLAPDNRAFNQPLCPVGTYARDNWPERGPSYRDVYQTLEGGIGTWISTRFPSSGPKWRVNAVPDCYTHQLGASGFGFHGDPLPWSKPGFAQLGNRLLVPPDGITFAGTNVASLFGSGWIALPLIPAYTSAAGVPTGDHSWTVFFHAANFRGPVGFFPPETWTAVNAVDRTGVGRGHDRNTATATSAAVEIGEAAMFTATASNGLRYRRIARMTYPVDNENRAILVQDVRFYGKPAIWDGVAAWLAGGAPARQFSSAGTFRPGFEGHNVGLYFSGVPVQYDPAGFTAGAVSLGSGRTAFGLQWGGAFEPGVFPEYYQESGGVWRAVPASQVPADTGLAEQRFTPKTVGRPVALDTSATSPWTSAKWAAGPFSVRLNDGSTVDYVWYRFRDQPALQGLGLSTNTLERLQAFAESLHREAGVAGVSFAPPTSGALAQLDTAQIVTPPPGLEAGFVPIAIRQYSTAIAPMRDFSDLWWNPDESGWGLAFTQHGTTAFGAWYIYDAEGRPLWVVMPGGQWRTPSRFTGDIYTTTGPDPRGAFDPAQVAITRLGSATLEFTTFDRGTLSWQAGALAGSKPIVRQAFGQRAANAVEKPNYGDLWWNPAESGWGLSISQQNRSLFAVWYVYQPDRQPTWYVLPAGEWISTDTWRGRLYRTASAAVPLLAGGAFDPAAVQRIEVGTMSLRFTTRDTAVMTYTIDGVTGTKDISRQAF